MLINDFRSLLGETTQFAVSFMPPRDCGRTIRVAEVDHVHHSEDPSWTPRLWACADMPSHISQTLDEYADLIRSGPHGVVRHTGNSKLYRVHGAAWCFDRPPADTRVHACVLYQALYESADACGTYWIRPVQGEDYGWFAPRNGANRFEPAAE